jgi:hypothetical protein
MKDIIVVQSDARINPGYILFFNFFNFEKMSYFQSFVFLDPTNFPLSSPDYREVTSRKRGAKWLITSHLIVFPHYYYRFTPITPNFNLWVSFFRARILFSGFFNKMGLALLEINPNGFKNRVVLH